MRRLRFPPISRSPVIGVFAALAMGLAVQFSIGAALTLPSTSRLDGYPAAESVAIGRVAGGIAPVSHRLLDSLFGSAGLGLGDLAGVDSLGLSPNSPPSLSTGVPLAVGLQRAVPVVVSHPFTNDDFAHAYEIPSVPFTAKTSTANASRESGEPSGCSSLAGTAWYRYTPTLDGGLFASTFGTDYGVSLAVYTGSSLTDLRLVGCDTSTGGNAQVGFVGNEGENYYLQVAGVVKGGNLVLNLDPIGATRKESVNSAGQDVAQTINPPRVFAVEFTGQLASYGYSLSGDGRFLVFMSNASNLDPYSPVGNSCVPKSYGEFYGPTRATTCHEVYVRDRLTGKTTLVSRGQSIFGTAPPNGTSSEGSISADGRYIAFTSAATNLVKNDRNGLTDVFVKDMLTGRVTLESHAPDGSPSQTTDPYREGSRNPKLSADGRYLTFQSDATNLGAKNDCLTSTSVSCTQVYQKDLRTGRLTVVSALPDGGVPDDESYNRGVSGDGSTVVFASQTRSFGERCANACPIQMYAWDRTTRRVTCVSCRGNEFGNGDSPVNAGISYDGRYIGFESLASNLVPGDTNNIADAFVLDQRTRKLSRISVDSDGRQQELPTTADPAGTQIGVSTFRLANMSMSADGRFVAFMSQAGNLVPGVTDRSPHTYLRDQLTGGIALVSVTSIGERVSGGPPILSADGRVLSFNAFSDGISEVYSHVLTDGRP